MDGWIDRESVERERNRERERQTERERVKLLPPPCAVLLVDSYHIIK